MEKFKAFLKRKDIEISLKRYGIDALGAMAQGLFCSLLIGTIINTIGTQFNIAFLTEPVATVGKVDYTVGGIATAMSGPAMAVAIGYALKCPPLVLFSMISVGFAANALGGAGAKDEEAARKAIAFLKKNRSGRATFLPETVCRIYDLRQEDEIICNNTQGYLGVAADFCSCSSEFDIVRESLLSNTIVTDDLENANNLANLLNYRYKIVTLEGDIVHKGGSMTGGKVKNEISLITAQSELNRIQNDYVSYQAEGQLAVKKYNDLVSQKESLDSQLTEKRIAIAQLEPIVDTKRAKYEKLQAD